jgi:hypothetical protein
MEEFATLQLRPLFPFQLKPMHVRRSSTLNGMGHVRMSTPDQFFPIRHANWKMPGARVLTRMGAMKLGVLSIASQPAQPHVLALP